MSEMLLLYALLLAQQNDEESSSSDESTDYEEAQEASRRQQTSSSSRNRQNSVVKRSEKVTAKTPTGVRNKTKIVQNTKKRCNVSRSSTEEQKVKRTKTEPTASNMDSELQNENSTNDINSEEADNSSEEQKVKTSKTEPTFSKSHNNLRNENSSNAVNTEESINDCCSVIITHRNYPKTKLSGREIRKIKENLLTEIDKTENIATNLGFLSCVLEDGWLLLNCQNTDTRDWVMNIINKLNNTLKMDLKATNSIALQPKTFICSLNIPLEDVMPPDALKYRLAKQNVDLLTEEWCFLNIIKSEEGGECVSYRIDEKSKDIIEARGCKLFLNFSQITVQTTPD